MTSRTEQPAGRRALVIGTGLIGGSLGLALRGRGWRVTGRDIDRERLHQAVEVGVIDEEGDDPAAELAFVATPASVAAEIARELLDDPGRRSDLVVSDVSGVKAAIVAEVGHPRFVGGHPMAGSEQLGLEGADGDLFHGATWVLTPTSSTDPAAYARVQAVVRSLGAEVLALTPTDHDRLVAVVSHVPHLVAATLMDAAAEGAKADTTLLRLAAGGFRDMTRVAAGHPGIWPDICAENAEAIVSALDRVIDELGQVRGRVLAEDRAGLLDLLTRASAARRNLPVAAARPDHLSELRVPVPDREGVLAELTTLASDLGVNIMDIEIAHSAEGTRGVLSLLVDRAQGEKLRHAVVARGYRASLQELGA